MDDNILDILGLQLVNYFINQQDYRPFNVPKELKSHVKSEVYLTNKDIKNDTYHIIKIIKENNFNVAHLKNKDEVFEVLKEQLTKEGVVNIRYLKIILNDDNKNENHMSQTLDVIIATSDKIVNELAKFYPNIVKFVKVDVSQVESESDDENNSDKTSDGVLANSWKKINFQNRRYLSDTLNRCSNSNLAITWFFFILPIITFFIFFLFISQGGGWLALDYNLRHLLFGASQHHLVFGAHQYWRWLVYPFAGDDISITAPINLLFALWMFYRVGRFVEGFYGWWKAIIIWVGAVLLTGILQSVVDINIMSGFWVFTLISLGAMLPFIWNYKLFKTPVMNRFFSTLLLMLVFWYFTNMQIVTLLYWMIAFAAGWLFASLVGYHNRKITPFYAFSPVALGGLVLFSGLVYLLDNHYPVDYNNYTLNVLLEYNKLGLISKETIHNIMLNYFHVNVNL